MDVIGQVQISERTMGRLAGKIAMSPVGPVASAMGRALLNRTAASLSIRGIGIS
jgi:hypothetical protein